MQISATLKQVSISAGVALVGGILCLALWLITENFTFENIFVSGGNDQSLSYLPPWVLFSVASVLAVAIGITIEQMGTRRGAGLLAGAIIALAFASFAISYLFRIDVQFVPIAVSVCFSAAVVHARRLWSRDRELSFQLAESTKRLGAPQPANAKSGLVKGLKLLETVLQLDEAIVFRIDSEGKLVLAARLRPSHSGPLEPSRNSAWRQGVTLCEKAIRRDAILTQPNSSFATKTDVALPLREDRRAVGAILIRLNEAFEDNDRLLLAAVGSQLARDLQQEAFTLFPQKSAALSVRTADQQLEAVSVLNGLVCEQGFGTEVLGELTQGLALARLDGTLAYVNAKLRQLANLNNQTTDLFQLLDRLRTDVFDEPSIAIRRVLQTGEAYERELHFADKEVTYGLRISLVRSTSGNNKGEPLCLAIHVSDETRAKEHERLKSDMISLMSHELRTPLTSINGFAELLNAEENLPESAKEFVTIIANESQRLSKMINTFLAVTKLQRKDKQEVLKIPLRLDEVAREIVMTLQPAAKKRRIRLVEQPAARIPPVAADKSLITQAVRNLVSNAIKYSPERTTVTVSTALEAETVRVSVEDRGYGIPTEARDRVWEKFYRVVREGQEKDDESTGLGLSFVRQVVEQHGGRVELESEEGRGSKFSFTIPRL